MRRAKLSKKVWITRLELFKFSYWVIWLFNFQEFSLDTRLLMKRISTLWKKSGSNFTFLYLKECARLLIRSLAGSPELFVTSDGIRVKRDRYGIPKIIPKSFRDRILAREYVFIRFVLNIISVYRVFPTRVKVKINTLTDPFVGQVKEFDPYPVLKTYLHKYVFNLVLPAVQLRKLESASPMAIKATWGACVDIIPFWKYPEKIIYLYKLYSQSTFGIILFIYFLVFLLMSLPFYLTIKIYSFIYSSFRINVLTSYDALVLGRLSVVLDQAGKARIVALTNYWIQLGLFPIHKSIFSILKDLETDGTFDQHKPLKRLISLEKCDEKYYCFDLSAATDRLPVELQQTILNYLKIDLGNVWRNLLDIKWLFVHSTKVRSHKVMRKTLKNKFINQVNVFRDIRYEVGQPMGAYSSWAMLALSHHVIVWEAARLAGISHFDHYAILGDDIVIRNKIVAEKYLMIMESLGVKINLSKSVISSDFAEFAKVYLGHSKVSFTPIGPGLILRTIRDRAYLGALLAEAFKTQLFTNYGACLKILQKLPASYRSQAFVGIWSCIGMNGAFWKMLPRDVSYIKKSVSWCMASVSSESLMVRFSLWNALHALKGEMIHDAIVKFNREVVYFSKNFMQLSGRIWSGRLFETVTRLVSPGMLIYHGELIQTWWELLNEIIKYHFSKEFYKVTWDEIIQFSSEPSFDVSSINWTDRSKIQANAKLVKKLRALTILIKLKSIDGSLGESNTLVLEPNILERYKDKDIQGIHRDLKPLVRYEITDSLIPQKGDKNRKGKVISKKVYKSK